MEMNKERKIVVAVDESEESMYALKWCIANLMSHEENYKLVLHYVKPPLPALYSYFDAAGLIFAGDFVLAMEKYGRESANSVMERAEAVCRTSNTTNNINMERAVGTGDAKDVICSTVQKVKADILVMGSHGYGFLKRALLGSVSDHCAKHAKCPVVIVKHP
ncbi:universal stress protein A-like protein [Neltuma alba]|uniref:universal stress protein A-like protein n=1 Tax=Neltuma alba TaxID=207710 RepID=UPI0010A35E07|nr:universal stress protein A-like protein [Prosopis alba]XP_028781892.1 universal stress protein A-like protein [Prosopis alba]XP_028797257.1 universal stress protein A-like protein [Prosopis alba]